MSVIDEIASLVKALEEGGGYNARPTKLHQCRRDNLCGVRGCDPHMPFEEGVDYCYDCGAPSPCNVDHTGT
jgi:hypothetical protein